MDKRKVIAIGTLLVLSSSLLMGCSDSISTKDGDTNGSNIPVEDKIDVEVGASDTPKEELSKDEITKLEEDKKEELEAIETKKSDMVDIWIPNIDYITSGDDSLPKLVKVKVEGVSEKEESNKYMRLLKTLNIKGDSPIQVLNFNGARLVGDVLEIDMSKSEELGLGGSTTEVIIIEQIKATLFDAFEEIKAIQFKIDGTITDTFLGHVEISEPFSR